MAPGLFHTHSPDTNQRDVEAHLKAHCMDSAFHHVCKLVANPSQDALAIHAAAVVNYGHNYSIWVANHGAWIPNLDAWKINHSQRKIFHAQWATNHAQWVIEEVA